MDNNDKLGFATKAIHAGQTPDPTTGAIMTPIFQTSTYVQNALGEPTGGYEYSRTKNPTRTALEANLAALEGGKYGICFASGCAATSAILQLLKTGDHVVLCDDVYGGTFRIFDKIFKQFGVDYTLVNMTNLNAVQDAFQNNTKLVWIETPTNPLLKIIDIEAIAKIAKQKNKDILVSVDNTFATPYLQNPLQLGADIVCHSTTKYLGGHSDVIGGAIVINNDTLNEKLHFIQNAIGAVPGPQDCFLILRSTKTLALRMDKHCENARILAQFLQNHSKVEKVIHPSLSSHPQHQLAKRQMRDFGGMVSIVLKGGLTEAKALLEKVKIFSLAESLGGVESLIEHPGIMTHAAIPKQHREALGISDNLIRLSVGIEDINDLIADLEQAL